MFFFRLATRNSYLITVDGTDEADEGQWILTSSDERALVTYNLVNAVDTVRNCLEIFTSGSSHILGYTSCSLEKHRAVFCESEGNYSRSYIAQKLKRCFFLQIIRL